ncbi:MAG: hypothetical protein HY302_00020 [Opitutae bacterium]|nr:hypothetical protein [Opitutae bacterium]
MQPTPYPPADDREADRMARLEARLARVEARLGLADDTPFAPTPAPPAPEPTSAAPAVPAPRTEDELEFQVGQNWFAVVGILVLAAGLAFTLTLPYASLPAAAPAIFGYALAAGLGLIAHLWRKSFELLAGYLRGAGLALLCFATLRLFFFGPRPVLSTAEWSGRGWLAFVVALNLTLAWRRKSPWLFGVALLTGAVSLLAVGAAGFVLPGLLLLTALAVAASVRAGWPVVVPAAIGPAFATYLLWALNDPLLGRKVQALPGPPAALAFVLACIVLFAVGALGRARRDREDAVPVVGALFNCGAGYGVFLLHSAAAFQSRFVAAHLAASAVFLLLAVAFWRREHSRISTFVYAMTGYMALSLAIFRATPIPDLFVWLSLQSVLVVATAIWFRSRFIVVANFLIYTGIVLAYVVVAKAENGISLGFGVVALVSARILNVQKERLELKSELMRNAYLLSAFIIFPYASYHLVPAKYAGLAWTGVALLYYAMNLLVRNQKYRWMGHGTLLLTALYLVIVGLSRFEPLYRNLSFLVLGTVLVAVSLVFTMLRRPRRASPAEKS